MNNDLIRKKILLGIYAKRFHDPSGKAESDSEGQHDSVDRDWSDQLEEVLRLGYASRGGSELELTPAGRRKITIVMTGGSFDIIHPGHLETLLKAKSLGDFLVVSVARDSTYLRNKKRAPLHNEQLRRRLVEGLKAVDAAVLGSEVDIYETAKFIEPDIIALGYDQSHNEAVIREELIKRGMTVNIVRLDASMPDIKSSKIAGTLGQVD